MTRGADGSGTPRAPSPEPETLAQHLRFLADHLGLRPVGSEEAQRARRYLAENLLVELGKGTRPLLFLAHYDTRPGTPGAFRNASGVTVLLGLLARLQEWETQPLIVGFLEGDELYGARSRHCRDALMALGVLTRLRGVLYVSGVDLSGLAVCAKESPRPSSLADLVARAIAERAPGARRVDRGRSQVRPALALCDRDPRRSAALRSAHDTGSPRPREPAAPREDGLRARARGPRRQESAMTRPRRLSERSPGPAPGSGGTALGRLPRGGGVMPSADGCLDGHPVMG